MQMVYKLSMASIRKSKVGKHTYWQIIESKRINGKPRPVVLAHLGTAEKLLCKLKDKDGIWEHKVRSVSHGAVELFYKAANRLKMPGIFDQTFSSQERNGLNVGQSLLLAAIHRAICPGSKRTFARWAAKTSLSNFFNFNPQSLSSQHFWDQMETVSEEQLAKADKEVTLKLVEQGLFSPKLLFYDLTNFFTYIATKNGRTNLAKRGHNKQKRHDLRQFGLAQVVTKDFLLPVFSEIYEGNRTDQELFIPFLTRVREKLTELNVYLEEITLVFDKGSNSRNNFRALDAKNVNYVASLSSAYHPKLLAVPLANYQEVSIGDQILLCYRTRCEVWGKERIVLIYLSEKLRRGQVRGLTQSLKRKYGLLTELKDKLNKPRAYKERQETVQSKITKILKGEHGPELIKVRIQDKGNSRFDIDWELDTSAYHKVIEEVFGKKILVTSQEGWSDAEIVSAYFGQSNIERVFKHLKNPYHNAVHPQYHWTDQKIKVHTFICLIGLLLSQVLWKKARDLGYNYSIERLIDMLSDVRMAEIFSITGFKGKPAKFSQLEEMEPELKKLYQELLAAF
jgi:transposase